MKNFIKERNPILLVSFIFSIVVFIYNVMVFSSLGSVIKGIMPHSSEYSGITIVNLGLACFMIIFIVLLLFVSLFIMIGYLYKKEEYIFVSIGLLVVLSFMFAFSGKITISFIVIIWCIINVIGLMQKKKN